MASPVTIDNFDVAAHERYARDMATLELKYIKGAEEIPSHIEVIRTQSKMSTKWEELFETHLRISPFANFRPPPLWGSTRSRFFSHTLCESFAWGEDTEDDDEETRKREEQKLLAKYKKSIQAARSKCTPIALFERDRSSLLSLLDSVQELNGFLRHISARRLQYQKG